MKLFSEKSNHRDAKRRSWFGMRAFKRNEDGSTAIEFSIIALPFFLLIFSIFEVGFQYFADRLLNAGVDNVARMIRTGQTQANSFSDATQGSPQEQFRDLLCAQGTMVVFRCEDVVVDVQQLTEFGPPPPVPRDADGNFDPDQTGFAPGSRLTVNLVRAFYEWPTFIPWNKWTDGNWGDDNVLLVASTAFQNEPYTPTGEE